MLTFSSTNTLNNYVPNLSQFDKALQAGTGVQRLCNIRLRTYFRKERRKTISKIQLIVLYFINRFPFLPVNPPPFAGTLQK